MTGIRTLLRYVRVLRACWQPHTAFQYYATLQYTPAYQETREKLPCEHIVPMTDLIVTWIQYLGTLPDGRKKVQSLTLKLKSSVILNY